MTAPNEDENVYYEIINRPIEETLDDPAEDQLFTEAIQAVFEQKMADVVVPDDDEDAANAVMTETIISLARRCFFSGATYQWLYGEARNDKENVESLDEAFKVGVTIPPVGITPEMATSIVLGLMNGDGVTLKLVVDRGQE